MHHHTNRDELKMVVLIQNWSWWGYFRFMGKDSTLEHPLSFPTLSNTPWSTERHFSPYLLAIEDKNYHSIKTHGITRIIVIFIPKVKTIWPKGFSTNVARKSFQSNCLLWFGCQKFYKFQNIRASINLLVSHYKARKYYEFC